MAMAMQLRSTSTLMGSFELLLHGPTAISVEGLFGSRVCEINPQHVTIFSAYITCSLAIINNIYINNAANMAWNA